MVTPASSGSTPPDPPADHHLLGHGGDLLDGVSPSDRLVRIQGLLSQWLRMENVIVLMGSGTSVSQGGPLLNQLENDVLKATIEVCNERSFLTPCIPVIEHRLEGLSAHTTSYQFERWLSYLANSQFISSQKDSPLAKLRLLGKTASGTKSVTLGAKRLGRLIDLLSHLIFLRCSLKLPRLSQASVPTSHHAFLSKLVARDASLGRTHIFTTNYDTLIEQALGDLGIQCFDGFTGTVERRFDASVYGLDLYFPGEIKEGRVRRFDKVVHLYKPHGSVNWRRGKDGVVVQRRDPRIQHWDDFVAMSAADKVAYLKDKFPPNSKQIGILPTDNKFVQTLGMPYAHLFRSLNMRLHEPQTFLVVIGYSFGDDHLNAIIEQGLTNPGLVLLVVDPVASDGLRKRIARYQQTGERAFLLCERDPKAKPKFATFDDFAANLLPQVQWLDDFVRLSKLEATIKLPFLGAVTSGGTP